MYLIGINGLKRSGKNTVATILKELAEADGKTCKGLGLADKIKELAAGALGIPPKDAIDAMDEAKEKWGIVAQFNVTGRAAAKVSGREYLQNIGHDARRLFGRSFWLDQVLWAPKPAEHSLAHYYGVDYLVITDVRYGNEAERIAALGGQVWEVVRPGLESDGHETEQSLREALIDLRIENDGDLDDLRERVEAAYELHKVTA